ncbi:MAG: GAF domain-containing protein [Anaerolineales bacterium]|nr:GAF domain-containing protein [Anaerolineales bacterium]MCB9433183.1 GAF domain-containing protein [Ardenticatenaceae bacterium]
MSGEFILVIDDSKEIITHLTERVLPTFGYKTLATNNGRSGLQMIRKHKPDLIMLDYNLPEMTGIDVLQEMAQESISIPVILMTGYGSELAAIEAFRLGIKDYLIKPFTVDEVVETIEHALSEKRLLQGQEEMAEQLRRLKMEMSRQTQQMKTLFRIGKAITSLLSVDQVLERVLEAATFLTNAEESAIWLPDKMGNRMQFYGGAKGSSNKATKTLPAHHSQLRQVLQSGQSLRESLFTGSGIEVAEGYFARAVVHVPLKLRGDTIGILTVSNQLAPRSFSKRDEFLLSFLADYAAIALENAQVYQETDQALARRLEELNTLIEITRTVTSSLDMNEVVNLAIKQVHKSWQIEAASVWLLDEAKQTLRVLTNVGTPPEKLARLQIPVGEGFVGHVAETARVVYTNDVASHALHYRKADVQTGFLTRSILCVPLVFRGSVIGVLQLLNKRDGDFDEADADKALAIASAVAIALTNAVLYEEAEATKRYKDDFVATISHDMRSPLATISGFVAELPLAGELNEAQQVHVQHIDRAVSHMMDLVNGLLDLAKVSDPQERSLRPLDVAELVQGVVQEFQGQAWGRRITLSLETLPSLPLVEADAVQLRSAIGNLIDNAIKYSYENQAVEVAVTSDGRNVLVQVADQGVGITEKEMPHIFEKFYRGKLVNGRGGAGLGLALVRSIAVAHGGSVWAESRGEAGTVFTLRLPAMVPEAIA